MRKAVSATVILLVLATGVAAHDFWVIPNAFRLAAGSELVVFGRTSSAFPASVSAVTPDRVAEAVVLSATDATEIDMIDVSGPSLRLRHTPRAPGDRIVAVRVHPRSVPESAESFREYLLLEGAPDLHDRYQRAGLLPTDSVVRRYAKYAKALVRVGADGPLAFDRVVGHPLELVPVDDPRSGTTLVFRLLFEGVPLAEAVVHAESASTLDAAGPAWQGSFRTAADGSFRIPSGEDGLWSVRALHIVPAGPRTGADWDVHWATFVFARSPDGDADAAPGG